MADNMEYLSRQKKESEFKVDQAEEMISHLEQVRNVEYERKDGTYQVYFESKEEEKETEDVMASDEKLIEYYKEHDPKMLESYNSRWSINVVGKKKDKKALRKAHLKSRSVEGRKERRIKEYRDLMREGEKKERKKASDKPFEADTLTDEQIEEKIRDNDTADVVSYYKTYREMSADQLDLITKKTYFMAPEKRAQFARLVRAEKQSAVRDRMRKQNFQEYKFWLDEFSGFNEEEKQGALSNYLYNMKDAEIINLKNKVFEDAGIQKALDKDLTEGDSPEIMELQTKYAKLYDETYDYKTYRLLRMVRQTHENVKVPPEVHEKAKKKKNYDTGDINRTCSRFFKPVNYIEKDGKQIPATKEDEENLAFNQKWVESLLSDKEEDWDFRFETMVNIIEEAFEKNKDDMANFNADTFDYEKVIQNFSYYDGLAGRILCISGINRRSEENALTHSKYWSKLPKERQKELDAKHEALATFCNAVKIGLAEKGIDTDKGGAFFYNGGEQQEVSKGVKTAKVWKMAYGAGVPMLYKGVQDAMQAARMEKWRAASGMDDPELLQKKLEEAENPQATLDDIKVLMPAMMLAEEGRRQEYKDAYDKVVEKNIYKNMALGDDNRVIICPIRYVLRDKSGKPLNEEEEKKEKWNKEWCDAVSDETKSIRRLELLQETFERVGKVDVPDLNEVKKKGAKSFYLKDPVNIYEMCQFALKLDNLRGKEPFADSYEKSHKEFSAKVNVWANFATLLMTELSYENLMQQGDAWKIESAKRNSKKRIGNGTPEEDEERKEEYRDAKADVIELMEKAYSKLEKVKKDNAEGGSRYNLTEEKLIKNAEASGLRDALNNYRSNPDSYKVYQRLEHETRYLENPLYRNCCSRSVLRNETVELSRSAAAVLRKVSFDDKWQPISEEDKKNHEWNMTYLMNLSGMTQKLSKKKPPADKTDEEKKMEEMAMEEAVSYRKNGFTLPDPDIIQKEIIDKMKNQEPMQSDYMEKLLQSPGEYITYQKKALSMDNISNIMPDFKKFLRSEENVKLKAYYDCSLQLSSILGAYTAKKYGLSLQNNTIDFIPGFTDNVMVMESQMQDYRELYNKAKG